MKTKKVPNQKSYTSRLRELMKRFHARELRIALSGYLHMYSTLPYADIGILVSGMIKTLNTSLKKAGTWK